MITDMDDHELLRKYDRERSEEAFRELVDRHLGMVYAAARRMVGDWHLAEEVAQDVFCTLARKAGTVRPPQVIAGWLYQTTRHLAMHGVRSEQRRREREQAAAAMQLLEETDASAGIIEHLEPAMQRIEPAERDILVLRYLEDRSLRDVGRELGISEDAARMRVNRALERLREMFEKEGVTASSALLSTVLLSTAATAVPAGLAAAVTTAALTGLATGISAGAGTAAVATSWWTAKTAALIVGAVAITGAGFLLFLDRANRPGPAAPGEAETPPREAERATASDSGPDGQGVGDAGAATTPVRVENGTEVAAGSREEAPTAEAQRLVDEAYALRGQQRYEDAEPLVNQALSLSPNFPDAHLVLGMVHEGLGRLEEAAASHTRALELRPTYLPAWYERSRIMAQMKRYDDAAADCTRAIELDPSFWQAWLGRGRARFEQLRFDEALPDFDRAIELYPKFTEGYHYRAVIHLRRGEADLAIQNRRLAVEQEPENALLHFRLGSTLRYLERHEEALATLSRAIELDPAIPGSWRERGLAHARLGQWKEAIGDYTENLRIEPGNHPSYSYRGMAWLELGELDKALADLNRAVRLYPEGAIYYLNRGRIFARMERQDEAMADFSKSIELQPARNTEAWNSRGHLRYHRREYDEAMSDFERVLELDRNSDDAALMAGCAALALGQDERAIEFLGRALKIKPDSTGALEYRAQAQAQRERWTEAIKDVSEAIRLRPDTGRLRLQRCWYHLFAGDMTAAVTDAVEGLGSERLEVREKLYLGIVASLGRRGQGEREAAKTVLDGMTVTAGSVWPGAIVRFLKGESTLEELNASAVSPGEKDQARVFAGWLDLVEGRRDAGRARLQSVIENGPGSGFEHHLARALLTTERGGANPEVMV